MWIPCQDSDRNDVEDVLLSSSDFARMKNLDGIGQLASPPVAAAELAQDAPGFELGVGALARAARPGVSAVGVLLRGALVLALYGTRTCGRRHRRGAVFMEPSRSPLSMRA